MACPDEIVASGLSSRRARVGLLAPSTWRGALSSRVVWCALATIGFALLTQGRALQVRLGDPDDAVRLISVRALLHGASWFDTTLPRIGAPEPLVSHWSRLIDAPLALLIGGLTPLAGPERAELAVRFLWPLLLLFALLLFFVREGDRRAGRWGAGLALVFATTSITATVQFLPGRIDHHNALILCTVAGLLLLVDARRCSGWPAGIVLGLALAIGYEPIALILPALGLVACAALWTGDVRRLAETMGAATLTLLIAFMTTMRVAQWRHIHCDALSANLLVLLACSTAGVWIASQPRWARSARFAVACAGALAGVALFVILEPACLRGPFGQVNPAIKPLWLDTVMETYSILNWLVSQPALGVSWICFVGAGAAAQVATWRRTRDVASGCSAAILVLAVAFGAWQVKLTPYVSWLAAMGLAGFVAQLPASRRWSAASMRATTAIALNHAVLVIAVASALTAAYRLLGRTPPANDPGAPISSRCTESTSLAPLSGLPAGLVAADLELGPHIVAWSNHRVVAAPYHRLDRAMLANDAILTSLPAESFRKAEALGVTYLALCQDVSAGRRLAVERAHPESLQARLLRNERVDFLEELTPGPSAAVRVWLVRR